VLAAVLLASGVLLMVGPALLRDGICGLLSCADTSPQIAITRTSSTELAIVVPEAAASSVRSVELLEGGARGTGSRRWFVQREWVAGSSADGRSTFPLGQEPPGFRTVTELEAQPTTDTWTAQVGFRCTTASLPFAPEAVAVGDVLSWSGPMTTAQLEDASAEHCTSQPGTLERVLLVFGAALAVAGAVLGIVVVLRRPARFPEDPDDEGFDPGAGSDLDQNAGEK
jgi:hypothetical protein